MSTLEGSIPVSTAPWPTNALRRLIDRTETIRFLVSSNLKAGHRDKLLGQLWSLLDPALFIGVYFLVFGVLFGQSSRARPTEFLLYLVIGVIAWRFTDTTISQAAGCIRANRGLIHGANFPKSVFPVSLCCARLYDYAWGLVVLFIVMLIAGVSITAHMLWLPLIVLVQTAFVLGCAFLVAYLGAFFADTVHLVSVGLRLWFYGSPILYYATGDKGLIPEQHLVWYMLNPVACLLESYRSVLLYGQAPNSFWLMYAALFAIAVLIGGFALFSRAEGEFAKHV